MGVELNEVWRPIEEFGGEFFVSNRGRVMKLSNRLQIKVIRQSISRDGYCRVKLKGNLREVGRLVAEAFLKNPDNKHCVGRIDRDKENNNVLNLFWTTHKEKY